MNTQPESLCQWCNLNPILPSRYPSEARRFCSKSCAALFRYAATKPKPIDCPQCGVVFTPKTKNIRFCSTKCAGGARATLSTINCSWCHIKFQPKNSNIRFCSRSCASIEVGSRPEIKEINRQNMLALRNREDVQEKLKAHLFGDTNPFKNPEVGKKAQDALKVTGYSHLTGGNGTGPTVAQEMLFLALGGNWEMELVIRTNEKSDSGYPPHYKVDIGNQKRMIAVEVHGQSHLSRKIKEKDTKKKEKLESLGWVVLSYWNHEVIEKLDEIVGEVLNGGS